MTARQCAPAKESGFSLIELLIAMAITLVIMGVASSLLAASFRVREREDRRSDAIADAQRGLAIMSREVGNAGFPTASNGIVPGDSDATSIRVRTDLNNDGQFTQADEDLKYSLFVEDINQRRFLVRYDVNTGNTSVLANRIDDLQITYLNRDPLTGNVTTSATPSSDFTVGVLLNLRVVLPAVGPPGTPGHQPAHQMQIESQVTFRNSALWSY